MNILIQGFKRDMDTGVRRWVLTLDRPVPAVQAAHPDDVMWVTGTIKRDGVGRFSTTFGARRHTTQADSDERFLKMVADLEGDGWMFDGTPFTLKHDLIPSSATDQSLGHWAAGLLPYLQDAHV